MNQGALVLSGPVCNLKATWSDGCRTGNEVGRAKSKAMGPQCSVIAFPIGLQVGIISLHELLNLEGQSVKILLHESVLLYRLVFHTLSCVGVFLGYLETGA